MSDRSVRIWETQPIRERVASQRKRAALVERLTPRVEAWLANEENLGDILESLPDSDPRERQVVRQILLGRRLGQAH